MAQKRDLHKEIRELRSQVAQLYASEQQLKASEQQLKASEQQLRASEQQLRALNQQLAESEYRFRTTVESISDGFFILESEDLVVTYFNQEAEKLLGRKQKDILNRPLFEAFPEAAGSIFEIKYREAFETGRFLAFETYFESAPYTNWYDVRVHPGKGKLSVFFQVITHRKQAERELMESQQRFEMAMEASRDGLFDWNLMTNEIYYSPGWKRMLGYEYHELPNDFSVWENLTDPVDVERSWKMQNELINKERDRFEMEFRMKHKQGHWVDILSRARAYFDDSGKAIRIVGTHVDITERKRAELQREKALAELKKIEWLLMPGSFEEEKYEPDYGDLTELNTSGPILHGVGKEMLSEIAGDYLGLLGTSSAVYEDGGAYALGIFSSGWCRFMDKASRKLCQTDDNRKALNSGKWLCHESCWTDAAKPSMQTGKPVDIECNGGIRIYALPIRARGRIIGSINFGYGDPPSDQKKLMELAKKYRVDVKSLIDKGSEYESRPPYIIDMAKRRLQVSANLIGEIVERKQVEQEVEQQKEQLRKLNNQLITAQEEERRKISRELHDELGQTLTALSINISGVKKSLPEEINHGHHKRLNESLNLVSIMTEQLKEMILDMRPSMLDHLGLVPTIRWLTDRMQERTGLEIQLESSGFQEERLPPEYETALFRIIQESLTNVSKHANASKVNISFDLSNSLLEVVIEDNGKGFDYQLVSRDPWKQVGFGLLGMQERLRMLNGELNIDSKKGKGTSLRITIPRPDAAH